MDSTETMITSILLFDTDKQTLVADVLAANPTATTFLLNCPAGTDSDDCGTYNETVVVGPWAQPTPPPEASTGVYDMSVDFGTDFSFHLHCDMSMTVPVACTTTNLGGNDDGSPTATFTSIPDESAGMSYAYVPVTITGGLEKLASATGTVATTSTGSGSGSTASGAGSVSASTSGTQSAASATGTSAAILGRGEPLAGTLGLVGLALAWLLR